MSDLTLSCGRCSILDGCQCDPGPDAGHRPAPLVTRWDEFKAAWDRENARRPYDTAISIEAYSDLGAAIVVNVNGHRRAVIDYNDITSPAKPWSVRVGNRRELKFASLKNLVRGGFWTWELEP